MPDYSNGKIYQIVCNETGLCYIGSTCYDKISQRLAKHTTAYRTWIKDNSKAYCTSFAIFEKNDYQIELIELYPCTCIDELTSREGLHQRNNECVNRRHEGRDHILYLEYHKKYYADNQVQQLAQRKQYYAKNKDQVAEYYKKYRDKNAVEFAERNKKYYEQNKDIINQKRRDQRLAKKLLSASIV